MGLSKRALAALRRMQSEETEGNWEDGEIVRDGRAVYLGIDRLPGAVLRELLDAVAVSERSEPGGMERFGINGVGKAILRRPELADEVAVALLRGGAFTVGEDDTLVDLAPPGP